MKSTFRLNTALRSGRTKIDDVYFEAPFKLMSPFVSGAHSDFLVMLASPGFLNGDEAHITCDFGPGTDSTIKTQSYEKVLNTEGGEARRSIHLTTRGDATAVFLPFPVIPFAGSSFTNITTAEVSPESTLVYADVVSCGRAGMGERWLMHRFTNSLRVSITPSEAELQAMRQPRRGRPPKRTPAGRSRLAFADHMVLEPARFDYTEIGMWREYTHNGLAYAHLPERDPEPGNADQSPAAIRSRTQTARIAAEDALITRIRAYAEEHAFPGEFGASRCINGICVRLLTHTGQDAFDFITAVTRMARDL
jgi:urease accessory protein